jgi:hypothetical protein
MENTPKRASSEMSVGKRGKPDTDRLEKFYYGSATKDQGFKKWRPEHGITTDQYEKEPLRWGKLLNSITRK